MIEILIADDHPIVSKGLRQIVDDTSDIIVAGEACTCQEVLNIIREHDFDVILLDIWFPDGNGLDLLKQIKAIKPNMPVLILSMFPEDQYAVRTLRAGASGYLTKDSLPDELIAAVRKVSKGGKYVSPTLAEKLAHDLQSGSGKPIHETLSDRELQVVCMLASGKTVRDIGEELSLSIKTINTYRSRILKKLNLKNSAEITRFAIENRLVY